MNQEADRAESKKPKRSNSVDLSGDCILQGYLLKLGGPFLTQWQKKYFHLFPNRLEWRTEPNVSIYSQKYGMLCRYKCYALKNVMPFVIQFLISPNCQNVYDRYVMGA